jgi:hypothetical protein
MAHSASAVTKSIASSAPYVKLDEEKSKYVGLAQQIGQHNLMFAVAGERRSNALHLV